MGRTGVEEQGASPPFAGDLGYASSVFKQFPDSSVGKESACSAGDPGLIPGFDLLQGKIPWRRKWQLTPVFLPGKSRGQEPGRLEFMGSQESDTT